MIVSAPSSSSATLALPFAKPATPPVPSPLIVEPAGGSRSVSVTLPAKRAETGPTLALTLAVNSVSETFSMVSQPGMHCFKVSGLLRCSQTIWRGAGIRRSPCISIGRFPSRRLSAECRPAAAAMQPRLLTAARAAAKLTTSPVVRRSPRRPEGGGSERQLQSAGQSQPAGQLLHLGLGMGGHFLPGIIERRDEQVLQDLDLLRIDNRLVELDLFYVPLAVQRQLHHAAAGHPGHLDGGELLLHLGHLLLHLLCLLHQLADIFHQSSPVSAPSSPKSSPASASASSAPGSAAATRSRTEAIVAPGKASSTARTNGWATTSFRSRLSRVASCAARVGAPASCETATT